MLGRASGAATVADELCQEVFPAFLRFPEVAYLLVNKHSHLLYREVQNVDRMNSINDDGEALSVITVGRRSHISICSPNSKSLCLFHNQQTIKKRKCLDNRLASNTRAFNSAFHSST